MAVDVIIVATDPDKRLTQTHVAHSVFDPENPKEIIDGAFNIPPRIWYSKDFPDTYLRCHGDWLSGF